MQYYRHQLILAWYLPFWFSSVLVYYTHIKMLGLNFFKSFFIYQFFQIYAQYFEIISAITVLQRLKQCYQIQKIKLEGCLNSDELLQALNCLEHNLLLLKDCVNYFNKIFGWSILLYHIFGICKTLIYVDSILKREILINTPSVDYTLQLYTKISILVVFWVY